MSASTSRPGQQQVIVRMPADLHEAFKARAETEERSFAQAVRHAMRCYLDRSQVPWEQVGLLDGQAPADACRCDHRRDEHAPGFYGNDHCGECDCDDFTNSSALAPTPPPATPTEENEE